MPATETVMRVLMGEDNMAREFLDNDENYYVWLSTHSDGFVLNTNKGPVRRYMVLHRASCSAIKSPLMTQQKGFTGGFQMKVCASTIDELNDWIGGHRRSYGSFSKRCRKCNPQGNGEELKK